MSVETLYADIEGALDRRDLDPDYYRRLHESLGRRLEDLRGRFSSAYGQEIAECEDMARKLESRIRPAGFAIYSAPACRYRNPNYTPLGDQRPTIERGEVLVIRDGQLAVRRAGRARVADAFLLIIGGTVALRGPRAEVLQQARWATLMDAMACIPLQHLIGGKLRARWRYWRRREQDGRRPGLLRARAAYMRMATFARARKLADRARVSYSTLRPSE